MSVKKKIRLIIDPSKKKLIKPQRISLSRRYGFNLQAESLKLNGFQAVNCARPSLYGNPFIVGLHGDTAYCIQLFKHLCAGLMAISLTGLASKRRNGF